MFRIFYWTSCPQQNWLLQRSFWMVLSRTTNPHRSWNWLSINCYSGKENYPLYTVWRGSFLADSSFQCNYHLQATRTVVAGLRVISANSEVVMFTFLLLSTIHITASVSLYCSVSPCRTKLFLPWLISHMFIILSLTSVFICWTFITFFIDLLVSIVFPILSGLVLGVCILLWRLIFTIYRSQRSREAEKIKLFSWQL